MRVHLFAALLINVTAPLLAAPPDRVVLEAERAQTLEAPMVRVCATNVPPGEKLVVGASGESYLLIAEKAGNPPARVAGKAAYEVTVPADGTYTLWARVYWEGECSNSFSVQFDDRPAFLFGEDSTYRAWHWTKYPVSRMAPPIQLTKGTHRLVFLNREDGVRLDQIVLSSSKRFVPVDIETPTAGGQP